MSFLGNFLSGLNIPNPTQESSNEIVRPGEIPMTNNVFEDLSGPLLYLKDQVASKTKKGNTYEDLFAPENLSLTAEEYNSKINTQKVDPLTYQGLQLTATLDDDKFIEALNGLRQQAGLMPMPPQKPELQNPNWKQGLVAALTAVLSPEHAFDVGAVPFQHQLSVQADQDARNQQTYQAELMKWQNAFNIDKTQAEALMQNERIRHELQTRVDMINQQGLQRTNELNFQADVNREQIANAQSHDVAMFQLASKEKFALLNADQKFSVAMANIQMALNPGIGPEARKAAAENAKSLGFDIQAYEGLTMQEAATKLQMDITSAEEKRRAEMFPIEKAGAEKRNILLDKEIKWFDPTKKAQLEGIYADIANTKSVIANRAWSQEFAESQEGRAWFSNLQGGILDQRKSIGSIIGSIDTELDSLRKQLNEEVDPSKKAEIQTRMGDLQESKDALIARDEDLHKKLEELDSELEGKAGITLGPTALGEKLLGTKYVWGGSDPKTGLDCSGLTSYVAKKDFGVAIPRTAKEQYETLPKVELEKARTGDFLYFSDGRGNWHTGILVIKDGQKYLRHSPQSGSVVQDTPLEKFKSSKKFVGVRRAWKEDAPANDGNKIQTIFDTWMKGTQGGK